MDSRSECQSTLNVSFSPHFLGIHVAKDNHLLPILFRQVVQEIAPIASSAPNAKVIESVQHPSLQCLKLHSKNGSSRHFAASVVGMHSTCNTIHSQGTCKLPAPLGRCATGPPSRDGDDRNPNPTLYDDYRSYFWKWGFIAAPLSVSSHSVKLLARQHPSGLDDDDLAILVLHEIPVLQVIQPLRIVAHAVLRSPSSD